MRPLRVSIVTALMIGFGLAAGSANAQEAAGQTGYAAKKPVFGGSCPTCPWGAIGDIVKAAMKPHGWDVQVCYSCAGGPRASRMVADAMKAGPVRGADAFPTPNGPVDFGGTGAEFLQWAYLGIHDFSRDPQGPRNNLRMIANIQTPTYYVVAVRANSGITDLRQISEKRMPVKILARAGFGEQLNEAILGYYGLDVEKIKSFGGSMTGQYTRGMDVDVVLGFGTLANAPEFLFWYDLTQKYDFRYLEFAPDLRARLVKEFYLRAENIPLGLFRGIDRRIPAVARTGTIIYGRADMPEDFAYTLAKALDEQQELLQWSHMPFSYNSHTVSKSFDIPLHPGAARYYREKGLLK